MKIAINTKTSGKFKRETINGRSHIVTSMRPIRGDISMNGILYPNEEVKKSFQQLHDLPAPNGHPKINGVHVSAFKPASMNAFNVGGWIRNPKMNNKEVIADFVLDETVANLSEDGREIIKRIENAEKIGVSTGLNIDEVVNKNGKDDFNQTFNKVGKGFKFDHVAVLLNEKAAGDHAGTEMILNTDDDNDPIYVVNLKVNELSDNQIRDQLDQLVRSDREDTHTWINEVFTESKAFIFTVSNKTDRKLFKQSFALGEDVVTLVGSPVEVILKKEFKPTMQTNEDQEMDKKLLILSIIANAFNAFTNDDKARLEAMDESELINALCVNVDEDKAREVLTTNGFDFEAYDQFKANEKSFKEFQESENNRIEEIKTKIIAANSDYTSEILAGKSEEELNIINKMIDGDKHSKRLPQGKAPDINNNSQALACDYSM